MECTIHDTAEISYELVFPEVNGSSVQKATAERDNRRQQISQKLTQQPQETNQLNLK